MKFVGFPENMLSKKLDIFKCGCIETKFKFFEVMRSYQAAAIIITSMKLNCMQYKNEQIV